MVQSARPRRLKSLARGRELACLVNGFLRAKDQSAECFIPIVSSAARCSTGTHARMDLHLTYVFWSLPQMLPPSSFHFRKYSFPSIGLFVSV